MPGLFDVRYESPRECKLCRCHPEMKAFLTVTLASLTVGCVTLKSQRHESCKQSIKKNLDLIQLTQAWLYDRSQVVVQYLQIPSIKLLSNCTDSLLPAHAPCAPACSRVGRACPTHSQARKQTFTHPDIVVTYRFCTF